MGNKKQNDMASGLGDYEDEHSVVEWNSLIPKPFKMMQIATCIPFPVTFAECRLASAV